MTFSHDDDLAASDPTVAAALLRVAALEWHAEPAAARATTRSAARFGRYDGSPPQVVLLPDGRLVRLLAALTYLQADGTRWPVPAGVELDGASIPRFLWSLIGGPFEGRYRDASIIHDHYCVVRTRSWRDTHRMFYDAMRSSGESMPKAKIMYYAVYRFGPRWDGAEAPRAMARAGGSVTSAEAESFALDAEAIHVRDLTLSEIEALADARNAAPRTRGLEVARAAGPTRSVERARQLVITGGSGNAEDVDAVAAEAALLPAEVLDRFERLRIRIVACRESVTDFETRLRGVVPRGWPPHLTWDVVPGTYFHEKLCVVVATIDDGGQRVVPTRDSGRHGSFNLTVHESLHGYDYSGEHAVLQDRAFVDARTADMPRLGAYEQQAGSAGLEETFAESGTRFVGDQTMQHDWTNLFSYWQGGPLSRLPREAPRARTRALREATAPIGTAELAADGSVVLDLRAEGAGGAIGHAMVTIGAKDRRNATVRAHVAGAATRARSAGGAVPFLPMKPPAGGKRGRGAKRKKK
jgi:hypothetical protein